LIVEKRFEARGMVEEALLRIELSPDVDEVGGFDPGNVCLRICPSRNALSRPMADVIHRGKQWGKPGKSARVVPANRDRRVHVDSPIAAYRLAAYRLAA
jgi:hypothetical protein